MLEVPLCEGFPVGGTSEVLGSWLKCRHWVLSSASKPVC